MQLVGGHCGVGDLGDPSAVYEEAGVGGDGVAAGGLERHQGVVVEHDLEELAERAAQRVARSA